MNDNRRSPQIQRFLDGMAEKMRDEGIDVDLLAEASDHPYWCRCPKCLDWWAQMGPEPGSESYGPFTAAEVEAYRRRAREDGSLE